jgi:hypothetical protein
VRRVAVYNEKPFFPVDLTRKWFKTRRDLSVAVQIRYPALI